MQDLEYGHYMGNGEQYRLNPIVYFLRLRRPSNFALSVILHTGLFHPHTKVSLCVPKFSKRRNSISCRTWNLTCLASPIPRSIVALNAA